MANELGWAAMTFNFRGCGSSEGDFSLQGWVDDLRAAYGWLQQQGVRFAPGGIRKGATGHDICFIHPKGDGQQPLSGEGVLIELVQAPPEVISALG